MAVTSNISGCQALRRRMGHILFGFRCVYGECIFITVSPNRRHSSLILRLSRARVNDTGLFDRDPMSPDTARRTSYWRHRYAASRSPPIFGATTYMQDPTGSATEAEVPLPEWCVRQQWLAQDPLASVHYYLVIMRIVVPAALGIRMCFRCPDCNADCELDTLMYESCSDYLGSNNKSMGGYAGIATAMAFANEFQGDGTAHGHGLVALANIYQHSTLEDIATLITSNIGQLSPARVVQRITSFIEHLHREDHFDDAEHQRNLDSLEEQFHRNNFGPQCNVHLSVRPATLEGADEIDAGNLAKDGQRFTQEYEADCQFIFSRVQHHWHTLGKDGSRHPMRYCQTRRKGKSGCCKAGFPKKVLRDKKGKVRAMKCRVRIVCAGVAQEMDVRTSGRRNMLGAVMGRRQCEWFSGTSAILAHLTRSNTNVQCPYRIPINEHTHDPDCTSKKCANLDLKSCV